MVIVEYIQETTHMNLKTITRKADSLIEDLGARTLLTRLDEVLNQKEKDELMDKLSDKFDLPESLDPSIKDYLDHCQVGYVEAAQFLSEDLSNDIKSKL